MKKIIFFLLIPFIFAAGVRVDLRYDYLRAGVTPRIQALGNTGIISATGPESAYFNPALLIVDPDTSLLVGATPLGFDQQQYFAFYKLPIFYRNALFSVGFVSHQVSDIEVRTYRSDVPSSMMSASDMMLVLGISRYLGSNTSFGMSISWMMDNYSSEQAVANFTFGLSHKFSDELLASTLVRYLGNGQFIAGTGFRLDVIDNLTIYASIDGTATEGFVSLVPHYGLEYIIAKNISIQAGYDGSSYSVGVRQRLDAIGFQIGYTSTDLGARYSLGLELF